MEKITLEDKLDFLAVLLVRCEKLLNVYNDKVGCFMNRKSLVAAIRKDLEAIDKINNFEKYKGN